MRVDSWLKTPKPQETLIPIGLRCQDKRIETLVEDIRDIQKIVNDANVKDLSLDGAEEIKWYQKSALKKKENLKILLNDQENRRLLLAEMTLMMENVVDKSKGLGYGDDFEEHY